MLSQRMKWEKGPSSQKEGDKTIGNGIGIVVDPGILSSEKLHPPIHSFCHHPYPVFPCQDYFKGVMGNQFPIHPLSRIQVSCLATEIIAIFDNLGSSGEQQVLGH